jgi:hypothetical protein
MATKKKASRTPSKKRGAKRGSARAKGSRSKAATRPRARKGGTKRIKRATKAVRRRARQGVEVAKEGLGKVKELSEKTWGTVKSATAGMVQTVKQRLAADSAE